MILPTTVGVWTFRTIDYLYRDYSYHGLFAYHRSFVYQAILCGYCQLLFPWLYRPMYFVLYTHLISTRLSSVYMRRVRPDSTLPILASEAQFVTQFVTVQVALHAWCRNGVCGTSTSPLRRYPRPSPWAVEALRQQRDFSEEVSWWRFPSLFAGSIMTTMTNLTKE